MSPISIKSRLMVTPPATAPALVLDSTSKAINSGSATSLVLPAFSTVNSADVVLIAGVSNAGSISSITGGSITFARVTGLTAPNDGVNWLDLWFAVASSPLSGEVYTVNFAGAAAFCTACVFAVSNAKTASPFSSSGPATTTSGAHAAVTASESNNFGVGLGVANSASPSNGYANLNSTALAGFLLINTKASPSPQSGVAWDSGAGLPSIAVALIGP